MAIKIPGCKSIEFQRIYSAQKWCRTVVAPSRYPVALSSTGFHMTMADCWTLLNADCFHLACSWSLCWVRNRFFQWHWIYWHLLNFRPKGLGNPVLPRERCAFPSCVGPTAPEGRIWLKGYDLRKSCDSRHLRLTTETSIECNIFQ